MYFSIWHFLCLFGFAVVFVAVEFWLVYARTKHLMVFSLLWTLLCGILCLSVFMMIEDSKHATLRNLSTTRVLRTESLQVRADIYNDGSMSLRSCTITLRLRNTAPRKVSGEIFDFGRDFDMFKISQKSPNLATYSKSFSLNLSPQQSTKIVFNVKFPPYFDSYKTLASIKCR